MAGHLFNPREITVKANLTKNLKNLYFYGVNVDKFYSRTYGLSEKNDLEDFIEEFKTNKAISILKQCVQSQGKNCNKQIVETSLNILKRKMDYIIGKFDIKTTLAKVKGKVYDKKTDIIDAYQISFITDDEWEIIGEENMEKYKEIINKIARMKIIGLDAYSNKEKPKQHEQSKEDVSKEIDAKELEELKNQIKEISESRKPFEEDEDEDEEEEENEAETEKDKDKDKDKEHHGPPKHIWETTIQRRERNDDVSSLLPEISSFLSQISPFLPQYPFEGNRNIWIIKPGGLSRGRGIFCSDELNEILSKIRFKGKTIIQKYIENPLIIKGRKFDIRQWVLVTNLSPLTIWMFDTPYLRFGAEDYSIEDFRNNFSQLTNNSIAKYSENFNDNKIEGDMWEIETFQQYLKDTFGKDYWPEIQEKIKEIVIYSLISAKHKIFNRKNSHEVFGIDLLIDEHLNVYLLEINASPAWDYSTKITEKLVKIMSNDLIKVVVDYADNMKKDPKERKEIDTGRLKMIYNKNSFPVFKNVNVNDVELV